MVNKTLRTMEVDLIIILGFFVQYLHEDIAALHSEQYNEHKNLVSFIVYRGQGLSKADFEQLLQIEGGLLAFNCFLSTTPNEQVARIFAESNSCNDNMTGVLFKMNINPSNVSTCFADISNVSHFNEEEEILFSMHSIFRIRTIQLDKDGRFWQMDLTLTTDHDKQLNDLTECIRREIKESEGWLRLGRLMIRLGHFNEAEELCEKLFDETTDTCEAAHLFNLLGMVKHGQGEYVEAFTLKQDILSLTDPNWADSFNNFGHFFRSTGEYEKALSFYELVLDIYEENSSTNDFDYVTAYHNIGLVHDNMDRDGPAVFYYRDAIEIMLETVPPNRPDLAISYNNVGRTYANMGNYGEARLCYKKAFEIQQNIYPSNHPDLAISYNNIGHMFGKVGQYSKALFLS
jgi:tetratricopeptide (TPR) repeat protein